MRACLVVVLVSVVALSGCASQEQKLAAASQIKLTDDQFLPYRRYTTGSISSPPIAVGTAGLSDKELIAQVDRKTGAVNVGLQFQIQYTSVLRRTYETARNTRAQTLPLKAVTRHSSDCSRKSGTCSFFEVLIVELPEAELRACGPAGYPVKVFAHVGRDVEIDIPKSLIVALFTEIDAGEKRVAAAAAH